MGGIVGSIAVHGCDIVEIMSIVVKGLVNVKFIHSGKVEPVNFSELEFI
jgi:hypothetical protein